MPRPPARFHPGPFEYHQEIELKIERLGNLGQGIARVDGWVIFVAYALPGEMVRARIFRNQKSYSEADLVEVLEPSPDRVKPMCPLFGECGGCQYQNLSYPAQLAEKRDQVAGLLRHMAGVDFPVDDVVPSPRPYHYRSKITPHFNGARGGETGPIGFLRAGRRFDLVDIAACPIAMESINEALPAARSEVLNAPVARKKGATLLLRATPSGVVRDPRAPATEVVEGLSFTFLAGDFFQNNPFILPEFTRHAREEASATGNRFLIDAYCGSGLFALTAASAFGKVAGVEVSESAARQATANAEQNGITNTRFIAGHAATIFSGIDFPAEKTSVIIDPPRAGTDEAFLNQLFAHGPSRVVYISCNPATQMRDLKFFLAAGYQLRRVTPFDLFPQTKHLECVMTLDRGAT
ncbi:MAG: class I SAM-dependent RNA methyltransferase [Verrucomicrobiales bacterium]